MIVKTLGLPVSTDDICSFADVPKGGDASDPLYPDHYIAVSAAHGITVGKTPTTFDPYTELLTAQLVTLVARSAELPEPPVGYTPVFENFSADHYPWARKAAYAGLLAGLEGPLSTSRFWTSATRGEASVLLYNLLRVL
jgi:hypothetical protein